MCATKQNGKKWEFQFHLSNKIPQILQHEFLWNFQKIPNENWKQKKNVIEFRQ